jgi:hypothetical protein
MTIVVVAFVVVVVAVSLGLLQLVEEWNLIHLKFLQPSV